MKILKAFIEVTHPDAKTTRYIGYPAAWLEQKEKVLTILYQSDRSDEVVRDGKLYQILFALIEDDLADELLTLPDFSLADKLELEAFSAKHQPVRTYLSDEASVLLVVAKAVLGTPLDNSDKEVLDPSSPTKGVNVTKSWPDVVFEQYGVRI